MVSPDLSHLKATMTSLGLASPISKHAFSGKNLKYREAKYRVIPSDSICLAPFLSCFAQFGTEFPLGFTNLEAEYQP